MSPARQKRRRSGREIGLALAMPRRDLLQLVARQLGTLLVFDKRRELKLLSRALDHALERIRHCFSFSNNKHYCRDGSVYFSPLHADQNAVFLYYLSNVLLRVCGSESLASRVYYLNKVLNSVELYYEVDLPDIFALEHPLGTVLGRARYSDFFFAYQGCGVGGSSRIYPIIGENAMLYPGVKIVGNSRIGKNCIFSTNTCVKDQDIPDDSLVFGSSPNLIIKPRTDVRNLENIDGKWKLRKGTVDSCKGRLPALGPWKVLKGKTVYLDPFRPEHISDEYIAWLNDPEVTRFLQVRFQHQTKDMAFDYIRSYYEKTRKFIWAIRRTEDGKMLGTIALPRIDSHNKTAGLGIMIGDKKTWGTPVAREALQLVLNFAFGELQLHRVFSQNVSVNLGSNFLLRRAGFRCEGKTRESYIQDGNYVDGFDFAILASEWQPDALDCK